MRVNNLTLTERPMKFDDVIGQGVIVKNLAAQSRMNKFFQAYLMYGHYGCGKTTTARILAAAVNCHHKDENGNPCGTCEHCQAVRNGCADMVEIDGASNTGIDNIRQLKEQAEYLPTVLDKKVYIIDEVHKLSDAAFNALLKVLEEPPAHVVFILATTDKDKIPATVLSRLAKYEFRRISTDTLSGHLKTVADRNGYNYTAEGLAAIARNSDGSVRNAIKMLEIVAELPGGITEENTGVMIGLLDPAKVYDLLNLLFCGAALNAFQLATMLMADGWDPRRLTAEMIHICSDAVLSSERPDLVDGSDAYKSVLKRICDANSVDSIIAVLDFLMDLAAALRESTGDRDVFRNKVLLFKSSDNNRIGQLERSVRLLMEKVMELENEHVYTNTVAVVEPSGCHVTPDEDELLDDNPPWNEATADTTEQPIPSDGEPAPVVETDALPDEADRAEATGKIPETQTDTAEPNVMIDPFAMFSAKFRFAQNPSFGSVKKASALCAQLASENVSGTAGTEKTGDALMNMESDYLAPEMVGSVEEFMNRVEEEQPVMDNLLELGFTRLKEGETTVFETDEPAFFNIGKAFAGAMGGFPFAMRKVE